MSSNGILEILLGEYADQMRVCEIEFMEKVLFQKKLEGCWSQDQLAPLDDLRECIELAEAWLESPSAYWNWFLQTQLPAFGGVTPQHLFLGKNGPNKLKAHLMNLKNGGYA